MLTLIEGGFYSSLHTELIGEIKRAIARGSRVYLIVPEQQTVMAECEMSELLSPKDNLSFEVTNFTRYANTMFRTIGGISGEYSTPVAKSLLMWRTLTELSPVLKLTMGKKQIVPGVVNKAISAIGEMQSLGITVEDLTDAIERTDGNPRLTEKLVDLELIYSTYKRISEERFNDTAGDADALAEMLHNDATVLCGTEIFIDGFTSFTEPQYRLIFELLRRIPVFVTLALDKNRESAFEYKEVRGAKERLSELANKAGTEKKQKRTMPHENERMAPLAEVCERLWASDGEIDNDTLQNLTEGEGRVKIYSAPTMYEECDFLVADIRKRLMAGAKLSDFAIIARDAKSYIGVLDIALDGAELPYFLSKSEDITSSSLVKLISTAYSIVTSGYRLDSVITYLKCGLIGISQDERDDLELYLTKWRIEGRRLYSDMPFNMNPRGYVRFNDEDKERLKSINETRSLILEPLLKLGDSVREAETVREHASLLLDYLKDIRVQEMLSERAALLTGFDEVALAEETLALWGVLCDALDVLVDVVGEVKSDAESFLTQLMVALSGTSIGKIPSYRDVITIGSADMLRMGNKRFVYLIGVNEGEFPAPLKESSYFTEYDKATLSRLGLRIAPDLDVKCAREYYSFSRAFSKATDTVTLLYAEKSALTKPIMPSDLITRIKRMTGGAISTVRVSDIPILDRLYTSGEALKVLSMLDGDDRDICRAALSRMGLADAIRISEGDIKNKVLRLGGDSLSLLYGKNIYLSETKISAFTTCPMKYFMTHELHLDEANDAEIDSLVIGSFVHGVVENVFTEAKALGVELGKMPPDERDGLTLRAAKKYVDDLFGDSESTARTEVTINRLVRATKPVVDGLASEFGGARYEPTFFELDLSYGDEESPNPLFVGKAGQGVILKGKIDRVDTFKSGDDVYVRVADYKTGNIDFLPSKLEEGEYLQMFIYLRAVTESRGKEFLDRLGVGPMGRAIPAGVIYVKTSMKDVTISNENEESEALQGLYKRDGMLLDDSVSISAMNPDFLPPMPDKPSRTHQSRLYDNGGWQEICDTVDRVVGRISGELRSGVVRSTPKAKSDTSCNWCPYKEICRNAKLGRTFK